MIKNLSMKTVAAIFDALPVDITFIDDTDAVRYYSKGNDRIFERTPAVINKKVDDCHPRPSLHKVKQVISKLKSGRRDGTEFWIDFKGRKIHIRYFAVKDKESRYLGTLEVTQDITDIQKISGEKRLLDVE